MPDYEINFIATFNEILSLQDKNSFYFYKVFVVLKRLKSKI